MVEKGGQTAAPFLRWAGSKRAALKILERATPKGYLRYIEPFAGSACLFFRLEPTVAVLSDLNGQLIDTFCSVRDSPEEVGSILAELPFGKESYYKIRALDPYELSKNERSARFIYLNRFCFNGLFRTNSAGRFNVPFGAPRSPAVPSIDELKRCSIILKGARLKSADFQSAVYDDLAKGDFVYLDPPFFQTEGRLFRQYNSRPFILEDLKRLQCLLSEIHNAGANFLMSYADNTEGREVGARWNTIRYPLQRNISGFAKSRGKANELLISNYDFPETLAEHETVSFYQTQSYHARRSIDQR